MDASPGPWNCDSNLDVGVPVRRIMRVSKDFVRMAVHVDPDVVVTASSTHITIENAVSLALRTTATCVLPYLDIEPVFFLFDIYVVESARPVDPSKFDIWSDTGLWLPLVCEAQGRPFGNLNHGGQISEIN